MPEDAAPNGTAPDLISQGSWARVSEMQAKLHRWAVADPGRRFDDLFNFVHHPATLQRAWDRVAGNTGAKTPGSDGLTAGRIEQEIGVRVFLEGLRAAIKAGTFRPQPVRERKIPKPGGSGKVRKLGIPTIADRVVQAALKLVLEPIFEADFMSISYGFRPERRAHDAVAEVQRFGSQGYHWVLDADIEACFDRIDHTALMDRVRLRVKDKRVLCLVKAFLKAGILTELGNVEDTHSGTPQGGILSPLLANIALSALDERLHRDWLAGGRMHTDWQRQKRRKQGQPTWRVIRYADDFLVMVRGQRGDVEALREEVASVLAPLGLRLSPEKTRIVHLSVGVDFLGFHLKWMKRRGTVDKWFVYTFIGSRPVRQLRDKIRALTRRTSQLDPRSVLVRLNQILYGWAMYFRHAVAKHMFKKIADFVWRRLVTWMRQLHRWVWKDICRWLRNPDGTWRPPAVDGIELINLARAPAVTRYRWRGNTIPTPWSS